MKIDLSNEAIEKITGDQLRNLRTDDVEENFYDMEYVDGLEENDEISMDECWFMTGYLEAI